MAPSSPSFFGVDVTGQRALVHSGDLSFVNLLPDADAPIANLVRTKNHWPGKLVWVGQRWCGPVIPGAALEEADTLLATA